MEWSGKVFSRPKVMVELVLGGRSVEELILVELAPCSASLFCWTPLWEKLNKRWKMSWTEEWTGTRCLWRLQDRGAGVYACWSHLYSFVKKHGRDPQEVLFGSWTYSVNGLRWAGKLLSLSEDLHRPSSRWTHFLFAPTHQFMDSWRSWISVGTETKQLHNVGNPNALVPSECVSVNSS